MNWQGIIVHHTVVLDTPRVETEVIRLYHMAERGWQDIGYNFVVEKVYDRYYAIAARPLYKSGSHSRGQNSTHIGVAFVGNFMDEVPHHDQIQAGAELIAGLCSALDISTSEIYPHKHFSNTLCPGDLFPFDELIAKVETFLI
jgi:hypothetical protein